MQPTITWILIWSYLLTLTGIKIYHSNGMAQAGWVILFYLIAAVIGYLIEKIIKQIR